MNKYLTGKLKEGRLAKGYKQSDVFDLTGIKVSTLSNYENGVTEPDMDTFLMLCELYGLDYIRIIGEAYGHKVAGTDMVISGDEITLIEKYRSLSDDYRKTVNSVLEMAYNLVSAQKVAATLVTTQKEESQSQDTTDILKNA